jgi:hypothetical protein
MSKFSMQQQKNQNPCNPRLTREIDKVTSGAYFTGEIRLSKMPLCGAPLNRVPFQPAL